MTELLCLEYDVIDFVGKAICSTNHLDYIINSLQRLTAYLNNNAVVLGQNFIDKNSNENPVVQEIQDFH